jgi:hypothetical protein
VTAKRRTRSMKTFLKIIILSMNSTLEDIIGLHLSMTMTMSETGTETGTLDTGPRRNHSVSTRDPLGPFPVNSLAGRLSPRPVA